MDLAFDPVVKSFLAPDVFAHRLDAAYGFQNIHCQLITATLRDVYLIESRAGRHILIVYRHGQRTLDQIAAEWRFVDYLAQQSVPVAPAISTRTGEQILTFQAPEGVRHAVVTTYVPGQHLRRRPSAAATRRYGEIVATIHRAADRAPTSFVRTSDDIATSLNQAVTGITAAVRDRPAEREYVERCGHELQERLRILRRDAPAYGIIHGDAIRANALVADDGSVTVIDFDWYGLGWRAYDVASYLLTIRGDPNERRFAEEFLSGYTAVRPLTPHEHAMLPLFEAVRAVLEIGIPALNIDIWGSAYLYMLFDQSLDRLKRCMEQLGTTAALPF